MVWRKRSPSLFLELRIRQIQVLALAALTIGPIVACDREAVGVHSARLEKSSNVVRATGVYEDWRNLNSCDATTGLQTQVRDCLVAPPKTAGDVIPVCEGKNTRLVPCTVDEGSHPEPTAAPTAAPTAVPTPTGTTQPRPTAVPTTAPTPTGTTQPRPTATPTASDAGWGPWEPFTGSQCVAGTQLFMRRCTNPPTGGWCSGSSVERHTCPTSYGTQTVLLVEASVDSPLDAELKQFVADTGAIKIVALSTDSPSSIKTRLKEINNIGGVVAVGEIPVPKFKDECNGYLYDTDLFYSDLDHTWKDSNSDGILDDFGRVRYAGQNPEPTEIPFSSCSTGWHFPSNDLLVQKIWFSRIVFYGGDKIAFYKRYFAKNHAYRTGTINVSKRGLAFATVNWEESIVRNYIDEAFSDVKTVKLPDSTRSAWLNEISTGDYQGAHLMAHSDERVHAMPEGNVTNADLLSLNTKPFVFYLTACSSGNFLAAKEGTLALGYLFSQGGALAVIADSQTAIYSGENFWVSIGAGRSAGQAFQSEFFIENNTKVNWNIGYFLFGDGSINLR